MTSANPAGQSEDQGNWSSGEATHTTSSGQGSGVSRIVTAWRTFFDSFMPPLGYEDETGFHFGDQPKRDQGD